MKHLQSLSYKTLFTILFFSLAGIVFFLKIGGKTTKVSAAWWDDMWHYRKAVTITENTGTNVNNLPIKLSINGLSNKAQSDCDDIRITDINGNIVNSQIETCDIDNISIIWIQDNIVANIQKTYYIYYGNPTAPAPSYNQNDTSLSVEVNGTSFQIKNSFVDLRGNTTNPSGAIRNLIDVPTELDTAQIDGSNFRIDYHYESALGGDAAATSTPTIIKDGPVFKQIGWTEAATSFSVNRNVLIFNNFPITFQRYQITNNSASSYTFNSGHHSMTESGRCYNFSGDSRCSASAGDSVGGDSSHGWFIDNTDNIGMCKIRSNNSTTSAGWRSYGSPSPTLTLNSGETSGWYEYYLSTITSGSQCDNYANIMYTQKIASLESPEETGGGPIAYWKFDEGIGTTVYDSIGTFNGSLIGTTIPTWQSEDQCISGKCLNSTGNGSVSIGNPSNFRINNNSVTIETWVKFNFLDYTNNTGRLIGFAGKGTPDTAPGVASSGFWFAYDNRNNGKTFTYTCFGNSAGGYSGGNNNFGGSNYSYTFAQNTWYHLAITVSQNEGRLYINGKQIGAAKTFSGLQLDNTLNNLYIGSLTGSYNLPGNLDEFRIYPYARTAAQIKLDYNSRGSAKGSSANLGVQSNTAPSLKSSLVAYWKFDENNGTSTFDSSSNDITGTFIGTTKPTWQTGKYKSGIGFSGVNDSISLPYQPNFRNAFTVSIWFKRTTDYNQTTDVMLLSPPNAWYFYDSYNSGAIRGDVFIDGVRRAGINVPIPFDGNWYHVVYTYDSTTHTSKMYKNGKLYQSVDLTSLGLSNYLIDSSTGNLSNLGWNTKGRGIIVDEAKIYNRAITDQEVLQDYNAGSVIQFGSSTQNIGGTTTSLDYCIPGDTSYCAAPVAEWKMDEGVGTSVVDTSGNNNTGTLGTGNSAPTWTQGKIGKALSFNGINNYSLIPNSPSINSITTNVTVSAWVKSENFGSGFRQITGAISDSSVYTGRKFFLELYNNYVDFNISGNGTSWDIISHLRTPFTINDNLWHYLVGVYDGSKAYIYYDGKLVTSISGSGTMYSSNSPILIGGHTSVNEYISGQIDQVKIYNYARTPAQIAYDYNKGAPVGWWKFDECQGNIAYDWSGNQNNGTIIIGSSGSQNSLGTCAVGTSAAWTNGSSGKINSSLNFDGSDDYITTSQVYRNDDLTWSAWVKTSNNGAIAGNNYGTASTFWHGGITIVAGKANMEIGYISSGYRNQAGTSTITDNKWHHIVMTSNPSGSYLYVDGEKEASSGYYTGQVSGSYEQTTCIGVTYRNGAGHINYFNGQIDDVRIYNYALTPEQIKQVYNGGAVNFQ